MVYTILISIVFVAELIITITIFQCLLRLDKKVLDLSKKLASERPTIKEISELIRKISTQWIILAQEFVDKTKRDSEDFLLRTLSKTLVTLLVFNLNFKFIKKLKNSKITKTLVKGYSFLESMV